MEREDVRLEDSSSFYGLAPNKIVRLRHGPLIRAEEIKADANGNIESVRASIISEEDPAAKQKIKGVLHFVSEENSVNCEVRMFDKLFLEEYPGNKTGNFLDDFNPESKILYFDSKVHIQMLTFAKVEERYQFERIGFFNVDYDTSLE